jgi:nucleoside-diphosphate-sugar epimerase
MKALKERGCQVFNYDLETECDIRNPGQLERMIEPGDKVLHLAAVSRFADADRDPLKALTTNAIGTDNVALACERNGAERLVYSSTGSVYMPIEQEPPITEEFPVRGNSNYACTKNMGELSIQYRCRRTSWIILRYAHLYGEGKIGHGAIGGFIGRMNRGLSPVLYGGAQSNDFTYISDVVQANVRALEIADPAAMDQAYNIGTGEELATEQVFSILADYFGYHAEFERLPARTVDPLRFVYSINKARRLLGYEPEYSFRKGIEDWFSRIAATS